MPAEAAPSVSEAAWLERLPKVELHLHLEGAIPLDALWELVVKYGGNPDVAHPIRNYFDRGMLVSVNTDDPKMFGNSLAGEYAGLMDHHGFTRAEIRELLDRTVASAWLEPTERDELKRELMAHPAWGEA